MKYFTLAALAAVAIHAQDYEGDDSDLDISSGTPQVEATPADQVFSADGQVMGGRSVGINSVNPNIKQTIWLENLANEHLKQGRSLAAGWANSMVRSVTNYACWCYFEDAHGQGRSKPVNDIDAQCKILHDGYSCIMMDAEDDQVEDCVPWEEDYNVPSGLKWWSRTGDDESMRDALRRDCRRNNRGKSDCAKRSCMVEGYFSINLFKLLTSGVKYSHKLKHEYGKFDPAEECSVNGTPSDMEKRCCGTYPVRFPYKYGKDIRQCCNGKTYNAAVYSCCNKNSIQVSCD